MIVLGLGSNCGDRLDYLRRAVQELSSTCVQVRALSPLYESDALLPDDAPSTWNQPFLNLNLLCESSLTPHELLTVLKRVELKVGRKPRGRWAPREIDIDVLALQEIVFQSGSLTIPHPGLLNRPFAILPFADLLPEWKFPIPGPEFGKTARELSFVYRNASSTDSPSTVPFHTRRSDLCFTELVGILNITPDSFSDGGLHFNPKEAIDQAEAFIKQGVRILDVGAESTRPQATPLSPQTEWKRIERVLKPLITLCATAGPHLKLSIDTRHPEVASQAIQAGAHWINDVSGFENSEMRRIAAESEVDLVIMHSLGVPPKKSVTLPLDQNPTEQLLQWAEKRIKELEAMGIARSRMIFDPGFGFGKTLDQTWTILREITRFRELGVRILVGHSRKSFFSQSPLLSPLDRDLETVALSLDLAQKSIDFLRIHNSETHNRALKVWTQANGVGRW